MAVDRETRETLYQTDPFHRRHIGPSEQDVQQMLALLQLDSLDALIDETIPPAIRLKRALDLPPARSEHEALRDLARLAERNQVFRSLIGTGYYDCVVPAVILRNILENPGWYTQYTPYQAEIAQGRLEALLNFQTMVADLTGLPIANASLLDEATAAAEAISLCRAATRDAAERDGFFIAADCHPQTIAVVRTRAARLGIRIIVGPPADADFERQRLFGILLQYPATDGRIANYGGLINRAHAADAKVVVATDLLALTLLQPPGEFGADVAVGSSQRFGVPLGWGGPHAAFIAVRDELKRLIPGRLVGVSQDAHGNIAYRLAIQTREQHIRREKATSNICTAQVLLAIMAGMYAVWHGPDGLRRIARRVHGLTAVLAEGLRRLGFETGREPFFDTLTVTVLDEPAEKIHERARERRINLRAIDKRTIGISLDEVSSAGEVATLWEIFNDGKPAPFRFDDLVDLVELDYDESLRRSSPFLAHEVFNRYHCEHELLRYIHRLESRDLSLTTSMIPLGSCTMKLNAAAEMLPIGWPEFARLHPFAPLDQAAGYLELIADLQRWLAEITGLPAVSLQPNAGSQGEYAGLLVIRAYHEAHGHSQRDVCLIPTSAHGTNPASAVTAGLRVVAVKCDEAGNIDLADLEAKAAANRDKLAALMVTYPSTHGVFEESIREICDIVHRHGGLVYMDGANMNAQVGLCRPGDFGADVCHLNLHKTFCIPHGGGGPGMGPIAAASHLAPFMPGHPALPDAENELAVGAVAAAPYGSPGILPIPWMYIAMMGADGLKRATQVAILSANYMAQRLRGHYDVLYTGRSGRVAHEFILDVRSFDKSAGIKVDDIAKRLMDFGFHAPTMSWPVPGTLMIEPTESESKQELDRLCDALIAIRAEIRAIEQGKLSREDNPLRSAPHTAVAVAADDWPHAYSRQQAAFPATWLAEHKFWPAVGRIDNVYGDRHLVCTCPSVESAAEPEPAAALSDAR